MSRKHFIAFAARIAKEVKNLEAQGFTPGRDPQVFWHAKKAAEIIADVCLETTESFQYRRFMDACQLPEIDEERALANLRDAVAERTVA